MILSFKSKETNLIWNGEISKKYPPQIQDIARRKLRMLNNSFSLNDLKTPPSNHLELLKGKRKGQYSIRINDQWRICFEWATGMNPKASFGVSLPSALRDCSTYQFRCAALSELEFQQQMETLTMLK
jgi:proteic killer suppression protein